MKKSALYPILISLLASFHPFIDCAPHTHHIPSIESLNIFTLIPNRYPTRAGIDNITVPEFVAQLQLKQNPSRAYLADPKRPYLCTLIRDDIPSFDEAPRLMVFSRGYAKNDTGPFSMPRIGGGVYNTHQYISGGCIYLPCVTFDYPDDSAHFNFGQDTDLACFEKVINTIKTHNSDAQLMLMGDCRGALSLLRFLIKNPTVSDTIVLASPLVSTRDLIERLSSSYLWMLGSYGPGVLKNFFKWYFPNYDPHKDDVEKSLHLIKGKRILIGHRIGDAVISDASVRRLASKLREHNEVFLLMIPDARHPHSKLYSSPTFSRAINAFYEYCGLPFDPEKAPLGKRLLTNARAHALNC